jgi:hypothetical protein
VEFLRHDGKDLNLLKNNKQNKETGLAYEENFKNSLKKYLQISFFPAKYKVSTKKLLQIIK